MTVCTNSLTPYANPQSNVMNTEGDSSAYGIMEMHNHKVNATHLTGIAAEIHSTPAEWCGGRDLNPRTSAEWILSPPPLARLGNPRPRAHATRWILILLPAQTKSKRVFPLFFLFSSA